MSFMKPNNKQTVLEHGTLPRNGRPYHVQLLDDTHLGDVLRLQQKVFDDLPDDKKAYILPKDRKFFAGLAQKGHAMLGIFSGGKLIAQSIIINPSQKHPETGMVDMPPMGRPDTMTVLEGVLVDAAHRGNKLMHKMVKHWLDIAHHNGRKHAIAEIATENMPSWSVFLDEGLTLHSIGTDPDDGTKLYNAHETIPNIRKKRLTGTFNSHAAKSWKVCKPGHLRSQKMLMKRGYKGVAYDKKRGKLLMAKPKP